MTINYTHYMFLYQYKTTMKICFLIFTFQDDPQHICARYSQSKSDKEIPSYAMDYRTYFYCAIGSSFVVESHPFVLNHPRQRQFG